jgi:Domain of unknown function (DUF4136)
MTMTVLKSLFRACVPLALLGLGACAQNFQANVNRFQALPAAQGQSFYIRAADPKLDGGLEFAQYARLVGDRLATYGYTTAASADKASLVVTVGYGVDEGKERLRSTPGFGSYGYGYGSPFYSGFGYGGRHHRWHGGYYAHGFYDPFLYSGFQNEVESYTVFTSDLVMNIEKSGSGERVFEGKAKAMSLNDNLTYLVPNLIDAMFTGFPGNSGETVKITVAPPKKKG